MADQLLSTDPAAGQPTPAAAPKLLSADPSAGQVNAASPPPAAPRQPVAARGSKGTPPFISDETGRMLGGMAGAGIVGAATEGLGLLPEAAAGAGALARAGITAVRALPSIVGAGAGGAAVGAAQGGPDAALAGAKEQAGLEAAGHVVGWPLRALGRRVLAHPVAKAAAAALESGRSMINEQLDTILAQAEGAVRGTREGVAGAVGRAREAARGAKAAVGPAEAQAAKGTAEAAAKWPGAKRVAAATEPPMAVSHTATPVTRVVDQGLPIQSNQPDTWVVKGHLDDTQAAQLNDMYKRGDGRVARGQVEGPVVAQGTDEFGNPIAQVPTAHLSEPPPSVGEADVAPIGGEAAHNATRTPVATAATPPPAASAREQVLRDTRDPTAVAAAKTAQQHAASAPPAVVHPGPSAYAQTGQDVADVIQGPAKHSLDQLGQAVGEAAKTGPDVDLRPIKAKLEGMASAARPSTVGGTSPVQGLPDDPEAKAKILAALEKSGVSVEESHPLPGVLSQIQNAPDTVSFEDAHKYKRLLDDATNWQSPAKKQLQGITKGTRNALRDALSVHPPYNQATEAYQSAVPLFTKGVAKQITRAVGDNPEAIAKLVKPDQPTKLQMLHDVLTHHASAGGGAEEGQQAWNGVRSALTWEHLIKPGIEKFDQSFAKFHPDVVKLAYGDAEGKTVLGNLQQISAAFKSAQEGGKASMSAARTAAVQAADTAARTSESGRMAVAQKSTEAGAVRSQVSALKKPTPTEEAFANSSLASTAPPSQLASEVLHAGASHGMGVFKARAVGKLLFSGPKVNDLVQWAAYSPQYTQMLVRAVTGPAPGMMLADLMRTAGIAGAQASEPPMAVSHVASAAPPR